MADKTPINGPAAAVPDDVFESAERLARREGRSRSQVYRAALLMSVSQRAQNLQLWCQLAPGSHVMQCGFAFDPLGGGGLDPGASDDPPGPDEPRPREKLRRALRADISDEAWATINSTVSRPFPRPSTDLACPAPGSEPRSRALYPTVARASG
jgi:hypothetical protein